MHDCDSYALYGGVVLRGKLAVRCPTLPLHRCRVCCQVLENQPC